MLRDLKDHIFFQAPDGLLYHLDEGRSKWLSVNRESVCFNIDSKKVVGERYMAVTGSLYSNNSGYTLIRNGTITGVVVRINSLQGTFNINIHKNKEVTPIYSINLENENTKIVDNINIDLNKSDMIQAVIKNVNGYVSYPEVFIEYGWRTNY